MEEGCVVCATSNRAPWELSASGLHEDLFAHFLTSLQNACRPIHLTSEHDYRRLLFSESQVSPGNPALPDFCSSRLFPVVILMDLLQASLQFLCASIDHWLSYCWC